MLEEIISLIREVEFEGVNGSCGKNAREKIVKHLRDNSNRLEKLVIKTEADTVNTISANQRAKRWAMMNFDKWNEVTGFVDPHISYYDEITALIEDAVEFGYGVALKQPLKEIMKIIKKSEGSL